MFIVLLHQSFLWFSVCLHDSMKTSQGRLPDYPGFIKRFITVEITLVSSILMILTLEKETRQSLGAPRVARTSHN